MEFDFLLNYVDQENFSNNIIEEINFLYSNSFASTNQNK